METIHRRIDACTDVNSWVNPDGIRLAYFIWQQSVTTIVGKKPAKSSSREKIDQRGMGLFRPAIQRFA
jgi:hypothetical protein